jgi:hypothetical protein
MNYSSEAPFFSNNYPPERGFSASREAPGELVKRLAKMAEEFKRKNEEFRQKCPEVWILIRGVYDALMQHHNVSAHPKIAGGPLGYIETICGVELHVCDYPNEIDDLILCLWVKQNKHVGVAYSHTNVITLPPREPDKDPFNDCFRQEFAALDAESMLLLEKAWSLKYLIQ